MINPPWARSHLSHRLSTGTAAGVAGLPLATCTLGIIDLKITELLVPVIV